MAITAQDINRLRQLTGSGMMDCKKALLEANGDMDKAIELLRKKGQKIAAARSDRAILEGVTVAGVTPDATYGVILALSSETDFVAKNDGFRQLANQILQLALVQSPATIAELKQLTMGDSSVEEKIIELSTKMGEHIGITAYETLQGDVVTSYIHTGQKLGVLVALQGQQGEVAQVVGKDVAMQIAALHPVAIDKDSVPPAMVAQELEIAREQSKAEAKDPTMLENIAQGRLSKFFKEHTLLNQMFIKDHSLTVRQYLDKAVPSLQVVAFKRVLVGAS